MSGYVDEITLDRIRAARAAIAPHVHRTPLLSSETAARVIQAATGRRISGGRLHLKAEHLQKTGSFKPRATTAKVASLEVDRRRGGIITISAGNAGQAYAWAARAVGAPATIVMPVSAVASKVEACRGYGAEVVLHGVHIGETLAELERLRVERGLTLCHPFDDPEVIAGNGSVGLELLEDLPDVDVVVAPIGGGGLISGVAAAIRQTRPATRIYGVEPEGSKAMTLALEAGTPVPVDPVTVADGLGAPFAGEWTAPICAHYLDDIVIVTDAEILAGLRFASTRLKQVVEPAGAAALAALLVGRVPVREGESVAAVLSGGNVATERLGELLSAAAELPGIGVA